MLCRCGDIVDTQSTTHGEVILGDHITEDIYGKFFCEIIRDCYGIKWISCVPKRELIRESIPRSMVNDRDVPRRILHDDTLIRRRNRVIIGDSYDRIVY